MVVDDIEVVYNNLNQKNLKANQQRALSLQPAKGKKKILYGNIGSTSVFIQSLS